MCVVRMILLLETETLDLGKKQVDQLQLLLVLLKGLHLTLERPLQLLKLLPNPVHVARSRRRGGRGYHTGLILWVDLRRCGCLRSRVQLAHTLGQLLYILTALGKSNTQATKVEDSRSAVTRLRVGLRWSCLTRTVSLRLWLSWLSWGLRDT